MAYGARSMIIAAVLALALLRLHPEAQAWSNGYHDLLGVPRTSANG